MPFRNILIVDDHIEIIQLMTDFLELENYIVYSAQNAEEAETLLRQMTIDCIILDVMLPGIDGFTLCKRIRKESEVPILFLSANHQTDTDKIRGLMLGADDYIVKTASPSEIVARVKAVERRIAIHSRKAIDVQRVLSIDQLELNLDTRSVKVANQEVELTTIEFDLLYFFMENEGIVLTYEQIIDRIWNDDVTGFHSVRVHVAKLREKLAPFDTVPEIKTIRSVGYQLHKGMRG
ncbi:MULTISPECIES: response regulator transcription factor [unclassified Lysinibacillus]|uniref:response regulator transcription factor n=1 Tax=unclassified Lysinibacillus TaxID=2636778 RepID=UPI002011C4DC|nr:MULTISPECIES: response regulator transcription factor [unclassified Lysinibacillus]MCL1696088.1 response regulator transcription factor [Lysinibacillus sp. BPa_S21]MCL1700538.1 response regulator transcription factor [Lysinibacillus sp. Bpr_S20]